MWSHPGLRSLYALIGAVVLVISPFFTLFPLLVKEHFGGGVPKVALIEELAGCGMVLGGLIVALIAPRKQVSWIVWGFATSCFALALTGLMPVNLFSLAEAWWRFSGLTFILGDASLTALSHGSIPNHLQGRAFSLLNMVIGLAAPVGLALTTPLDELSGGRWLFVFIESCLMGFLSVAVQRLGNRSNQ